MSSKWIMVDPFAPQESDPPAWGGFEIGDIVCLRVAGDVAHEGVIVKLGSRGRVRVYWEASDVLTWTEAQDLARVV